MRDRQHVEHGDTAMLIRCLGFSDYESGLSATDLETVLVGRVPTMSADEKSQAIMQIAEVQDECGCDTRWQDLLEALYLGQGGEDD